MAKWMGMEITKELILKNFENNVSPLQRKHIDLWLQDQANEEIYYKWLEEWENQNPEYVPDSPRLIAKYVGYLSDHLTEKERAQESSCESSPKAWYATFGPIAAAILLLFVTSAVFLLKSKAILFKEYKTEIGQLRNISLEDGTGVHLQSASSLWVPRWKLLGKKREVLLEGEAHFSVAHTDDKQKFTVKTDKDFEVVVLGTEFTISTQATSASVDLKKGKVRLNYREDRKTKHLIMHPGERVSFDKNNRLTLSIEKKKYPYVPNEPRHFVFDNTTLKEFASLIEQDYGFSVQIESQQLAKRKLMGSFMAQDLDELLGTLGDLLDIEVARKDDHIVFSSK